MTAIAEFDLVAARASIPVAEHIGTWMVVWCKARDARTLIEDLTDGAGIPSFYPMVQWSRVEKDKHGYSHNRALTRPLFSEYVSFCCGSDAHESAVSFHDLRPHRLEVANQPKFIREISAVERMIELNPSLKSYPVSTVGQKCKVIGGEFAGFEGKLMSLNNEEEFAVEIEFFGQLIPLEIDPLLLEQV